MTPIEATPTEAASTWLASFAAALEEGDPDAALSLFGDNCFWRDCVTFTWNIATFEGKDNIRAMLAATLPGTRPTKWALEGNATEMHGAVNAFLSFETAGARGRGYVSLFGGTAFTLFTFATELKGFEEPLGPARPLGCDYGSVPGRESWAAKTARERAELGHGTKQPFVVIVGGSHAGTMLAARLFKLGVPAIVVDKNAAPGDSWRGRYPTLHLHTPIMMDHWPYMAFPEDWPTYASKDQLADWVDSYAKLMQINFWGSSTVKSAKYDEATGEWAVTVARAGGETLVLRPQHLVLATGAFGTPRVPKIDGADDFAGLQYHSTFHRGGPHLAGKKCIVLGSNNSAHDMCSTLWEDGAQVTMIQRSPTLIIKAETMRKVYAESLAEATGFTKDQIDIVFNSVPLRLLPMVHTPLAQESQKQDAALHERLEKVGFRMHYGADGTGIWPQILRSGSGYCVDVGASELVANGEVLLASGGIRRINPRSVVLTDGTELPADVIVYATGYNPLLDVVAAVTSKEVAERVGRILGYGSGLAGDEGPWEGELRNLWKPTRQPGLWYHTGGFGQSRFYSLQLALQLKARMEGLPTPVYGQVASHGEQEQ